MTIIHKRRVMPRVPSPEVLQFAVGEEVFVVYKTNARRNGQQIIYRYPGVVRQVMLSKIRVEWQMNGVTYLEKLYPYRLEKRA